MLNKKFYLLPQSRLKESAVVQCSFVFKGLHSASIPGILALDIHAADNSRILTGGADKNATVFNKDTEQIVSILKGHTKKVKKPSWMREREREIVTCKCL